MLYYLFYTMLDWNLFRYVTFRAAFAGATAMIVVLWIAPWVIERLRRSQFVEKINNVHEGLYEKHKDKQGTPTMGGLMILIALWGSMFLWCDLSNFYVQLVMMTSSWLAMLGFVDDYCKSVLKRGKGLSIRSKLLAQLLLTIVIGILLLRHNPEQSVLLLPFVKALAIPLGAVYFVLMFAIFVGTCNAVNITDGLDGLAAGSLAIALLAFSVMTYLTGHAVFSEYLHLPFVMGASELSIVCMALVGACLGFLWFNAYPAQVFMGDTGSLPLGGVLGLLALASRQEILLVLVGGVFVWETITVIIQIVYFKCTGKRFFLIAPIHHHFQIKGWSEPKIVVRFWILGAICAVISLCILKIR